MSDMPDEITAYCVSLYPADTEPKNHGRWQSDTTVGDQSMTHPTRYLKASTTYPRDLVDQLIEACSWKDDQINFVAIDEAIAQLQGVSEDG